MTAPANTAEKAKHTPGPWVVGRALQHNARAVIGDGDSVVAILPGEWNDCTYVEADALLIAAAPELLEALQALLSADVYADNEGLISIERPDTESGERAVAIAHAAIAKATGATP